MILSVTHTSTYFYDAPVALEPHVIRLRPRSDGAQKLRRYELTIHPRPAGSSECLDQDGNVVTQAWFDAPAESLRVESRFAVEPLRENPFDFLLPAEKALGMPFFYAEPWKTLLAPYANGAAVAPAVAAFALETGGAAGGRTLPFLAVLNQRLFEGWRPMVRPEGEPYPAEETLAAREGSCRDLAVLFCEACRAMGFAARFVSGYARAAAEGDHSYMHAWAEVYLPGGGWRGYDPSCGLAVSLDHVAVAAAAYPALAAPLSGTYRGNAAARLEVQISMRAEEQSDSAQRQGP
jgi:transglutaminase-like putative cysteine protease